MHKTVFLRRISRSVVSCTVENKVSWLELLESELLGAHVELVILVEQLQAEAKKVAQIPDASPDQTAAVEEYWRIIERLRWERVLLRVRHTNVLLGVLDHLFAG